MKSSPLPSAKIIKSTTSSVTEKIANAPLRPRIKFAIPVITRGSIFRGACGDTCGVVRVANRPWSPQENEVSNALPRLDGGRKRAFVEIIEFAAERHALRET